jgi:hypothetical protein
LHRPRDKVIESYWFVRLVATKDLVAPKGEIWFKNGLKTDGKGEERACAFEKRMIRYSSPKKL